MADILSIGANAAQLYKSALATVGNNIANLNTDGYSRQVANSIEILLQPKDRVILDREQG